VLKTAGNKLLTIKIGLDACCSPPSSSAALVASGPRDPPRRDGYYSSCTLRVAWHDQRNAVLRKLVFLPQRLTTASPSASGSTVTAKRCRMYGTPSRRGARESATGPPP
jgi:hypothetical protein